MPRWVVTRMGGMIAICCLSATAIATPYGRSGSW